MKRIFSTKKSLLLALMAMMLLTGCVNEYNQVYKTSDYQYKYEYAKECFASGKYLRAAALLEGLISFQKGTDNAQESLYMLAMSQFCSQDFESASQTFKKYHDTYPKGIYAEEAKYYVGESLYQSTPEPRLDQSQTVLAIKALQDYLDLYPEAILKDQAHDRLRILQDKLIRKELMTAQLYYDLGPYFGNCTSGGNNYEACIVTAQNALNEYPYTDLREDFALLIMKSKFELAQQSIEEKAAERYQDAEDECYGFINEYPDSKSRSMAEKFIERCKKYSARETADAR